jgi:hypothetical protein
VAARVGSTGWQVPAAAAVLIVAGAAAGAGPLITSTRAPRPRGGLHSPVPAVPAVPARPAVHPGTLPPRPGAQPASSATVNTIWAVVAVALVAVLLFAAAVALIRRVRFVARTTTDEDESGTDAACAAALAAAAATRGRLRSGVDAALADLDETADARQAVLGCWLRLEEAVARTGAARAAAETSAELARRVLVAYAVERPPLDRLHRLYQDARYSNAPVPPRAREDARAALAWLRRDIERGSVPSGTASGAPAP